MFRALAFAVAVATALTAPRPAAADFTAYRCDVTGPVKPILTGHACAGFSAGRVSVTFPALGSGRLIASADGRTVVMLQSYLYGRRDARGDVIAFEGQGETRNPMALYVYRDGKLVAAHRIHDLVARRTLIWSSASHVDWVRSASIARDGELSLTTTDYRALVFDGRSGALTRAADAADWVACAEIAVGKLDLAGARLLEPFYYKRGRSERAPLTFSFGKGVVRERLTHNAHTVGCFVRQGPALVFARALDFP